jgi:hypothetical protein
LLSPHADLLFDRGWITFEDNGALVRSSLIPSEVIERIGLNLTQGRRCGDFLGEQKQYLEYHRNAVFERGINATQDSLFELATTSLGAPTGW